MTALLSIAIDVAIVATVALLAVALMRRQSAALRHLVLSAAFVAAALMPLLEAALPTLPVLEWPSAPPVISSSLAMSLPSASSVSVRPVSVLPCSASSLASFAWCATANKSPSPFVAASAARMAFGPRRVTGTVGPGNRTERVRGRTGRTRRSVMRSSHQRRKKRTRV